MLAAALFSLSLTVLSPDQPAALSADAIAPIASRVATPLYPRKAILKGIEGRVVTCFTVNLKGKAEAAVVMETSNKLFTRPALNALRASEFIPGSHRGENVATQLCRTFTFRLD